MMQRRVTFLMVFFCMTYLIFSTGDKVRLQMSVRVFAGKNPLANLTKNDFALSIDDCQVKIGDVIKKEKSISKVPGLGRNFILSFSMLEYSRQFENGISHFITEILRPEDTLLVLSPLRVYQVEVTADKMKMIREIAERLKNDCNHKSNKRATAEKHLLEKIRKLVSTYRPYSVLHPYVSTINFLETFAPEFLKFKEHYLLPPVDKYRQILDLLSSREGERWWIHFQKHEINILVQQLKEVFRRAKYYPWQYRWQQAAISRKISKFRKQLQQFGAFSQEQLLQTLLQGDIVYNIIFPAGAKNIDANFINSVALGVERVLEKISIHSGGITIGTSKFDQGLERIKDHVDHYYDLVFFLEGDKPENNISVGLKDKKKNVILIHKDKYIKEEPSSLGQTHTEAKVKIFGFSREENIISFSIGAYKLKGDSEKGENFGLLKVEVSLLSPQGERIYQRQNTLRASKDKLDITLTLPLNRIGTFNLSIAVYDLLANSQTSFEREIVL